MREQDIQRKIIKYLDSLPNSYVIKTISTNKAGVPDIIACIDGKFIAIEVKTPKTKNNISELQKYNLEKITQAGGYALVAWDIENVKKFISSLIHI
jgi:Holliday junction resolvase